MAVCTFKYPFQTLCLDISFYFLPYVTQPQLHLQKDILTAFWNLAVFWYVRSLSPFLETACCNPSVRFFLCSSSLTFWQLFLIIWPGFPLVIYSQKEVTSHFCLNPVVQICPIVFFLWHEWNGGSFYNGFYIRNIYNFRKIPDKKLVS